MSEIKIDEIKEIPEPGKTIYIPCKKCETDRYHKILAKKDEKSAKVECEVCHKKHTFRLKKPKKPRTTKKKKAEPGAPSWESLKSSIGTDRTQPYNMRTAFGNRAAIDHPKFGLGFVTYATPQKIDVVFEEGTKSLVHNRE